ncbi:MAG: hypothetical protein P1V81_16080, partial [Planctomycetota bacterium]|nr:hypothetical protein [Planctomycetota bacterium]
MHHPILLAAILGLAAPTALSLAPRSAPASAGAEVTASGIDLRVELGQHVVPSGTAFELTVTLDNTTTHLLDAVAIDLDLVDAAGVPVPASFAVAEPVLVGVDAADGSDNLGPGASASARFAICPLHAAVSAPTRFGVVVTVAAVLEGSALMHSLPARGFEVLPAPELEVELFVPGLVHGDWPATPSLFEVVEAFPVGLRLANVGAGAAVGLTVDSLGPLFTPDPTGAALGSSVVELELDGQVTPAGFGIDPSLLGDLAPGAELRLHWTALPFARAAVTGMDLDVAWASAPAVPGVLGGPQLAAPPTSLAHELVHAAELFDTLGGPLDDGLVDWLVDDPAVPAPIDPVTGLEMLAFPDLARMSAGPDIVLVPVVNPTVGRAPTIANQVTTVEFTAGASGWYHLRFDAPGGAYFDLAQVVRTTKALHLPGLEVGVAADVSRVWVTERPLDVTGDGLPDVTRRLVHLVDRVTTPGLVRYDLVHVASSGEALSADVELLSTSTGGTQNLTLDAGPDHAGASYILLGSLTGTKPGLTLDGVNVPLNVDAYFLATLTNPSLAVLSGALGLLDAQGRATAQVIVPTGFPAGVGLTAHHAFVLFPPSFFPITLASNP